MSKKNKSIQVKLIVNPGAGKAADAVNNLKLVTGYLEKNGFKVNVAYAKPKEEATPIARRAVKEGYKIVCNKIIRSKSNLTIDDLAPRFKSMSDDDLTTSGAFIQAVKIN